MIVKVRGGKCMFLSSRIMAKLSSLFVIVDSLSEKIFLLPHERI